MDGNAGAEEKIFRHSEYEMTGRKEWISNGKYENGNNYKKN